MFVYQGYRRSSEILLLWYRALLFVFSHLVPCEMSYALFSRYLYKNKSRAIAERTARFRSKFQHVLNFSTAQCCFSALPQHSFLVYMYISDHSNAEITSSSLIFTAVSQNHGDSRESRHTTKIKVKATVMNRRISAYFVCLETRIIGLHFAADRMGLFSLK